jgi:hypothetical protein
MLTLFSDCTFLWNCPVIVLHIPCHCLWFFSQVSMVLFLKKRVLIKYSRPVALLYPLPRTCLELYPPPLIATTIIFINTGPQWKPLCYWGLSHNSSSSRQIKIILRNHFQMTFSDNLNNLILIFDIITYYLWCRTEINMFK